MTSHWQALPKSIVLRRPGGTSWEHRVPGRSQLAVHRLSARDHVVDGTLSVRPAQHQYRQRTKDLKNKAQTPQTPQRTKSAMLPRSCTKRYTCSAAPSARSGSGGMAPRHAALAFRQASQRAPPQPGTPPHGHHSPYCSARSTQGPASPPAQTTAAPPRSAPVDGAWRSGSRLPGGSPTTAPTRASSTPSRCGCRRAPRQPTSHSPWLPPWVLGLRRLLSCLCLVLSWPRASVPSSHRQRHEQT